MEEYAYILKTNNFSEKNFNMEMINFEKIDSQDCDLIYSLLKNIIQIQLVK